MEVLVRSPSGRARSLAGSWRSALRAEIPVPPRSRSRGVPGGGRPPASQPTNLAAHQPPTAPTTCHRSPSRLQCPSPRAQRHEGPRHNPRRPDPPKTPINPARPPSPSPFRARIPDRAPTGAEARAKIHGAAAGSGGGTATTPTLGWPPPGQPQPADDRLEVRGSRPVSSPAHRRRRHHVPSIPASNRRRCAIHPPTKSRKNTNARRPRRAPRRSRAPRRYSTAPILTPRLTPHSERCQSG